MLYGLPPNLCCFVVPGLGKTPKSGLKNPTGASEQNKPKVGQGNKADGSVLTGAKQLSSVAPRLCTQPWSAICPKFLLEYVIIPIAAQIWPKLLKKQINDTARTALEMIDQLKCEEPRNSSGDLKVAYIHNLIEDLNLYNSDPLMKDVTEYFIKDILNQKFGVVPNEKFEEIESINRIKFLNEFKSKISNLKGNVTSQESREKGYFFDSVFQSVKELDTEIQNSIHCNDATNKTTNKAANPKQERKEYRNQATFAEILNGEVQHSDDD